MEHLSLTHSVPRRGNQPGQTGSSGASNPKPSHQRRMMRRHRLLRMTDSMSIHSTSPRRNTPVTWATESATTSLSLQPLVWRWEQTLFPSHTTAKEKNNVKLLFVSQLRKYFDTPLVHISPLGTWSGDQDALLSYTFQEDFMSSTWDWIGLYKVLGQT